MNKKEQLIQQQIKQLQAGELLQDVLGLSPNIKDVNRNISSINELAGAAELLEAGIDPDDPNAVERLLKKKYGDAGILDNYTLVKTMDQKKAILKQLADKGRIINPNALGMVYSDKEGIKGFADIIPNDPRYSDLEKAAVAISHEPQHMIDRIEEPSFKSMKRGFGDDKVDALIKAGRTELEELKTLPRDQKAPFMQRVYKNATDGAMDYGYKHTRLDGILGKGIAKNAIEKVVGKSVKALPFVGGAISALATGDASAAVPFLGDAEEIGLPPEGSNRDIELGNTLSEDQYKELVRNSLKRISEKKE